MPQGAPLLLSHGKPPRSSGLLAPLAFMNVPALAMLLALAIAFQPRSALPMHAATDEGFPCRRYPLVCTMSRQTSPAN